VGRWMGGWPGGKLVATNRKRMPAATACQQSGSGSGEPTYLLSFTSPPNPSLTHAPGRSCKLRLQSSVQSPLSGASVQGSIVKAAQSTALHSTYLHTN
jgi:hypothetical protein